MILAFDTYYFDKKAKTVCICFESWTSDIITKIYTETLDNVENYISGQFYKRELPCIMSLLNKIKKDEILIDVIIVDGYVYLDDSHKLGLGGYLYQALDCKVSIIGVGKTNFSPINNLRYELLRGGSIKPLYITSIGIELTVASQYIQSMHGQYRFPTLLKELDRQTKELL